MSDYDSFTNGTSDDVFDAFMDNRACQAALFADFVVLLNMKAASHQDNDQKMELLTEILNDLKLFISPPLTEHPH